MKDLITIIQGALLVSLVFVVHIVIASSTPYPVYQLHVIYLFLVWLLLQNKRKKAVWLGLVLGYLAELFSAQTFGVHSITLITSVILVSWLLQTVFTNHSWYMIAVIGICATLMYRVLFLFFILVSSSFQNVVVYNAALASNIAIEIAVNTIGLMLVYGFSKLVVRRANPRYI